MAEETLSLVDIRNSDSSSHTGYLSANSAKDSPPEDPNGDWDASTGNVVYLSVPSGNDAALEGSVSPTGTSDGKGFEKYEDFAHKRSTIYWCLTIFLVYLLGGTFSFSYLLEKWSLVDSMYYTVVTFTTCGFGDFVPTGDTQRIVAIFFILFGIGVLTTVAFGVVFEHFFKAYDNILTSAKKKSMNDFMTKFEDADHKIEMLPSLFTCFLKEMFSVLPIIALLMIGAFFIGWYEEWSPVKSLYFLTVVSTSVGYGDVTPTTEQMRAFCIVFIPFSIGATAEVLSRLTGVYVTAAAEKSEQDFMNKQLTEADIDRMDTNKDSYVSQDEFMKFMLTTMGKITAEDWDEVQNLFTRLDKTKDGKLTKADVMSKVNQKEDYY